VQLSVSAGEVEPQLGPQQRELVTLQVADRYPAPAIGGADHGGEHPSDRRRTRFSAPCPKRTSLSRSGSKQGAYRAQPPVDSRTRPSNAERTRSIRDRDLCRTGAVPAGGRVKDSNLGKHQPTGLQSVIVRVSYGSAHLSPVTARYMCAGFVLQSVRVTLCTPILGMRLDPWRTVARRVAGAVGSP
jgi:hypothetical protein